MDVKGIQLVPCSRESQRNWFNNNNSSSVHTSTFFIGLGFSGGTFLQTSSFLSPKSRLPCLAFITLTLFDLAVHSIWALRFNNARNSPGTCNYSLILISSLGPAAGSCTVESALTFLTQWVKEAGGVVGSTKGLRGENNLACNSVYPQQHTDCLKNEQFSLSSFPSSPQQTSLPSLETKTAQLYL